MSDVQAPFAPKQPSPRTHHGDTVDDPYAWLRDGENPEVLAFLKDNNTYTETHTEHLDGLREQIFGEIKSRTKETDLTVPSRKGDWWYYTRTEEGKQYGIHCRTAATGDTPPDLGDGGPLPGETILLDENALAEGHEFFALGAFTITPDGNLLAYSVDTTGDERFTLRFKDLRTGEALADEITGIFYGGAWSHGGEALFYTRVDESWRPYQVYRHDLGAKGEDALVHEETDERFWVGVDLSRSERYLFLESHSKITSEIRYLASDRPTEEFALFGSGRRHGVEVTVDHQGDRFLVLHNDGAENFTLGWAPLDDTSAFNPILEHRADTRILDVDAFSTHLVVSYRRDGLTGVSILDFAEGTGYGEPVELSFPEPIYTVHPSANPDYVSGQVRLSYTSMITPDSVFDYDLATRELLLRKRKEVLGGYRPEDYEQRREWAVAEDGTRVPISVMYRKGITADGTAPCLIYGYGSYETSIDPYFAVPRLSLVDRGMVFAIAHVRGGGEMGRAWYDNGKMLHKRNTFTDFVACAEHLVKAGWSAPDKLVARGGSAGGLLMGAIANLAPQRFAGVVADVPFVDALNTILDPSLPLTVIEWEEWGNPLEDPEVYEYMKSYTPYENVAATEYPAILAVTSLHDTRVLFHEPAKWIARLREVATGGPFLLKTEMEAGHGGRSGRYDAWKEQAFALAWILDTAEAV
ncbi:S9 family peptidase [Phytomonospora endophytica]|uniref:Oligopeptidase B n=1 Tax=Phytomonospora endophytica TaxID=714109 RepID=A0A841FJF8_9ACTN|nr:S9 family peptidase [Phytomonospora endophytica]MBB6036014.1 oligopeptidase B [Phytomonospora endophytica]GIG66919.1 protease [Phytomonospora endophytica]